MKLTKKRVVAVCFVGLILGLSLLWYWNPVLWSWDEQAEASITITTVRSVFWQSKIIIDLPFSPFNYTAIKVADRGTMHSLENSYSDYMGLVGNETTVLEDVPFLLAAAELVQPLPPSDSAYTWTTLEVYPLKNISLPMFLTIDRTLYASQEGKFRIDIGTSIVDFTHADIELVSLFPHKERVTFVVLYTIGGGQIRDARAPAISYCHCQKTLEDVIRGTTARSCRIIITTGKEA